MPLPASSKFKLVSRVNPIVRSPTPEMSHGSYSDVSQSSGTITHGLILSPTNSDQTFSQCAYNNSDRASDLDDHRSTSEKEEKCSLI